MGIVTVTDPESNVNPGTSTNAVPEPKLCVIQTLIQTVTMFCPVSMYNLQC